MDLIKFEDKFSDYTEGCSDMKIEDTTDPLFTDLKQVIQETEINQDLLFGVLEMEESSTLTLQPIKKEQNEIDDYKNINGTVLTIKEEHVQTLQFDNEQYKNNLNSVSINDKEDDGLTRVKHESAQDNFCLTYEETHDVPGLVEENYGLIKHQNTFSEKISDKDTVEDLSVQIQFNQQKNYEPLSLKQGILRHISQNLHKFNKCGKTISHKNISKDHKTQLKNKKYKCDICKKSLSRKNYLSKHMLIHTGLKHCNCDICKKSFSQTDDLSQHKLIHTEFKQYKCDICKRSLSRKDDLLKHMLIHTGLKQYKCDICEKSFSRKSYLSKHKIIHMGLKQYKCDICKKSFLQKDALSRHMLIHTGLKQYKCLICGKSFSRNCHLSEHMIIHTGLKQYKCDICKKSFSQKSALLRHMLIHTGLKQFNCDICEKSFSRKYHLSQHTLSHTGMKK